MEQVDGHQAREKEVLDSLQDTWVLIILGPHQGLSSFQCLSNSKGSKKSSRQGEMSEVAGNFAVAEAQVEVNVKATRSDIQHRYPASFSLARLFRQSPLDGGMEDSAEYIFSLFSRSVTEFRMGDRKREQNPSKSCLFVERPSGHPAVWYKGAGWLGFGIPPNIVYLVFIVKTPSLVMAWVLPDEASEYMHSHKEPRPFLRTCVTLFFVALILGALHAVRIRVLSLIT